MKDERCLRTALVVQLPLEGAGSLGSYRICLHGQGPWKLQCFVLTDCAGICSLGEMPCSRCQGRDCKLLVCF